MNYFTPKRIRALLKLALLGDCGCLKTLAELTAEARAQGMTGAEIDTALAGRSFEARADAAVGYACALKSGSDDAFGEARSRALKLGLTCDELEAVENIARAILAEVKQ